MVARDEASPDDGSGLQTATPLKRRIDWVDQAKGLAILLVVLYHAVFFMNAAGWGWLPLTRANGALASLRMPLFFFCSGLFFARHLSKPGPVVAKSRILPMMWLYIVWSAVFALFFSVVPWIRDVERVPLADLPWILVRPSTELWFLYALALYFSVTWLMNRLLPQFAQLALALGLSVWASVTELPVWAFDDMARHYVVFLTAVHFSNVAFRFGSAANSRIVAGAATGWLGLLALREVAPEGAAALIDVPLAFVAVAAGVAGSAQLVGTRAGGLLALIGSRTISIYVLHVLVLGALFAYLPTPQPMPWWMSVTTAIATTLGVTMLTAWVYPYGLRVPGVFRAPWIGAPTK